MVVSVSIYLIFQFLFPITAGPMGEMYTTFWCDQKKRILILIGEVFSISSARDVGSPGKE